MDRQVGDLPGHLPLSLPVALGRDLRGAHPHVEEPRPLPSQQLSDLEGAGPREIPGGFQVDPGGERLSRWDDHVAAARGEEPGHLRGREGPELQVEGGEVGEAHRERAVAAGLEQGLVGAQVELGRKVVGVDLSPGGRRLLTVDVGHPRGDGDGVARCPAETCPAAPCTAPSRRTGGSRRAPSRSPPPAGSSGGA